MIEFRKCRLSLLDERSDERDILDAIALNTAGHVDAKRAHFSDCVTNVVWVKPTRKHDRN